MKSLRLNVNTGEFYQRFKEELMSILFKLSQNTDYKRTLPNSFYQASITLITKSDKDTTRKLSTVNIPYEHRYTNPQQNTSKHNSTLC